MEILQGAVLCLDPLGGTRLDLLDDFRERAILREAKERMNVVARAADFDGWRILILEHSRQICVHFFSQGSQKEWFAMFRAEDEMNIKFGEGLAHVENRGSPFQGLLGSTLS